MGRMPARVQAARRGEQRAVRSQRTQSAQTNSYRAWRVTVIGFLSIEHRHAVAVLTATAPSIELVETG